MALKIDKVTLQFEIKPNYDAQQLNKLKEDLSDANKKLEELTDERKSLVKPKKSDKAAWNEYQQKLLDVTQRINQQEKAVKKATEAVEAQRQKMGLEGLTLRELQQELKRYNSIMANIQPGTEGFNEAKQHIDDIKKRIDELKGKLSFEAKDTKNSLMKFTKGWNNVAFAITNVFSVKDRVAGFVSSIRSTLDPMAEMAREAEGVELAFERMNRPDMLDQLRQATHGTVTDLELMKQAVKFNDFNLPVEQLGTYLAFAQQKAKDTNQKKFPGMTRWDVLCERINPTLQPLDKLTLARYIGEKVETSIRRNSTVKVMYEDWWLSDTSVLEKLRPNDYQVTAYYMPDEEGKPTEVYIFQGDRYIDHVERVQTYNRVMAEQTEEDVAAYIEQQKKISKFNKYVRDHGIEQVGVMRKAKLIPATEPEELEVVAAQPQHTERPAYCQDDAEVRAIGDL